MLLISQLNTRLIYKHVTHQMKHLVHFPTKSCKTVLVQAVFHVVLDRGALLLQLISCSYDVK